MATLSVGNLLLSVGVGFDAQSAPGTYESDPANGDGWGLGWPAKPTDGDGMGVGWPRTPADGDGIGLGWP